MSNNAGECLCGALQYVTKSEPLRVTICHCKFCQRATGSAFIIEPIFQQADFEIIAGTPATYAHRSEGSGNIITIHFCATCGTKVFLSFERFPDVIGVYGGTFNDPYWFERTPENSKYIFLEAAQHGTIIPPGFNTYIQHAPLNDGTPIEPVVFQKPHIIGAGKPE